MKKLLILALAFVTGIVWAQTPAPTYFDTIVTKNASGTNRIMGKLTVSGEQTNEANLAVSSNVTVGGLINQTQLGGTNRLSSALYVEKELTASNSMRLIHPTKPGAISINCADYINAVDNYAVAIGGQVYAGWESVGIGVQAMAGNYSVSLGSYAGYLSYSSNNFRNIQVGYFSDAYGDAVAIGYRASAASNAISIGSFATNNNEGTAFLVGDLMQTGKVSAANLIATAGGINITGDSTFSNSIKAVGVVTADSFIATSYGAAGCTDLGVGTNVIINGATYAFQASPTNSYIISVSNIAPRFSYSIEIFSTNSCTWGAGVSQRGSWTPTGTNLVVLVPSTGTLWKAYGKGL